MKRTPIEVYRNRNSVELIRNYNNYEELTQILKDKDYELEETKLNFFGNGEEKLKKEIFSSSVEQSEKMKDKYNFFINKKDEISQDISNLKVFTYFYFHLIKKTHNFS